MSDDDSWVFDSLICYLGGPVWNLPIINFIENKSIIFEEDDSKENEYKKVHDEYKNLVDFMLVTYMEEIGLTPEQFESVCGKLSADMKDASYQLMFEQVWAADDYDVFKQMMIQKNVDLQMQVLDLLQRLNGFLPDSFKFEGQNMTAEEKEVMQEVFKKSMEEKTSGDSQTSTIIDNPEREEKILLEEKQRLQEVAACNGKASTASSKALDEIDPDDLKQRQEHFRAHRDRLLDLKKKEREKLLQKYEKSAPQARPKSSRVAQKVIKDGYTGEPQTLQLRRALLDKIRNEVIDKN